MTPLKLMLVVMYALASTAWLTGIRGIRMWTRVAPDARQFTDNRARIENAALPLSDNPVSYLDKIGQILLLCSVLYAFGIKLLKVKPHDVDGLVHNRFLSY